MLAVRAQTAEQKAASEPEYCGRAIQTRADLISHRRICGCMVESYTQLRQRAGLSSTARIEAMRQRAMSDAIAILLTSNAIGVFLGRLVGAVLVLGILVVLMAISWAHDGGQYAGMSPQLHAWFDKLASGKGLCCSFADGVSIANVDWDTSGDHGGYRVRLGGAWIAVPDDAVVSQPNKFGPAVVWPYQDGTGKMQIRCFLPGAGA
jgi:hypothetical protein